MMPTKLYVNLATNYQVSPDEFVEYWKDQYSYPNQHLYTDNIHLREYTTRNLYDLFCWKNGMNLSSKKQIGFNKIAQQLDVINRLKLDFNEDLFESHFGKMTTVWKIFLRHVIDPERNPIFDQHVYRAYRYLHRQDKEEIVEEKVKEEVYHREYRDFYLDLERNCSRYNGKEIDDALWAFGKFISRYPKMII